MALNGCGRERLCFLWHFSYFFSAAVIPGVRTCEGDSTYPGKLSFGDTTNGIHIGAGAILESDKPVYVIYESSATNDKHNLMGRP